MCGENSEIEFRSDLNDNIIEVVSKKGLTHADVGAACSHISHSRNSCPEPQYTGHFDGSDVTSIGLTGSAGETPIQERCLIVLDVFWVEAVLANFRLGIRVMRSSTISLLKSKCIFRCCLKLGECFVTHIGSLTQLALGFFAFIKCVVPSR